MSDPGCQTCQGDGLVAWTLGYATAQWPPVPCPDCGPKPSWSPRLRWGTCCPFDPECDHSFMDVDQLARWMDTPITDAEAALIEDPLGVDP